MLFRKQIAAGCPRNVVKEAEDWLRLGHKVYHYRKDVLVAGERKRLEAAVAALDQCLRAPDRSESGLLHAVEPLKNVMQRVGSPYYPSAFWSDNVEMFLVAAILAIGIRSFFLQPFKIPTNSMFPTYHGMTYEVHETADKVPNLLVRVLRKVVVGAKHYKLTAPAAGEVSIPVHTPGTQKKYQGLFRYAHTRGRKWLVLPATFREYTIYVDQEPTKIRVPLDFNFDKVLLSRFFPDAPRITDPNFGHWLHRKQLNGGVVGTREGWRLRTQRRVTAGEIFLSFEILTGDALFVDRISYHFFAPNIGDPFVFRTGNIPGLNRGKAEDKYYIKRLVGKGGDRLEVREPELYRNGYPIKGAEAFALNAQQIGHYEGYVSTHRLKAGATEDIPLDHYYAMGDNSDESSDSRAWGFAPDKEVVGRAIFVYYPFTRRWGLAD